MPIWIASAPNTNTEPRNRRSASWLGLAPSVQATTRPRINESPTIISAGPARLAGRVLGEQLRQLGVGVDLALAGRANRRADLIRPVWHRHVGQGRLDAPADRV